MPQNAQKAQKCGNNKSPTIVLETSKKLHHTKSIENVKTSKTLKTHKTVKTVHLSESSKPSGKRESHQTIITNGNWNVP